MRNDRRRQLQSADLRGVPGAYTDGDALIVWKRVRQDFEFFSVDSHHMQWCITTLLDLITNLGSKESGPAGIHKSSLSKDECNDPCPLFHSLDAILAVTMVT